MGGEAGERRKEAVEGTDVMCDGVVSKMDSLDWNCGNSAHNLHYSSLLT